MSLCVVPLEEMPPISVGSVWMVVGDIVFFSRVVGQVEESIPIGFHFIDELPLGLSKPDLAHAVVCVESGVASARR